MATVCTTPVCPDDCAAALPIPKFRSCNPKFLFGNISDLYATNVGYPLEDETDPTEWADRMALPPNDPSKIIRLIVNAEKPDAEVPEVVASHGRTAYGTPKHTVQGEIDEVSDENYEFMRAIRCGKTIKFWYKLFGGKAYGGPSGVDASFKVGHIIPKSAQELVNMPFTLKWDAQFDPCVFEHPLQGDDSDLES